MWRDKTLVFDDLGIRTVSHDNVLAVVMLVETTVTPIYGRMTNYFVQANDTLFFVLLFFTYRHCIDNFMPLLLINTKVSQSGHFAEINSPVVPL